MTFERYQNLHAIFTLRELLRKWWRAELSLADNVGSVVAWSHGQITPPPNDFCRLSLFSAEGFHRCTDSVKALSRELQEAGAQKAAVRRSCHLGFLLIGAPIVVRGEYRGMLFVQGFLEQQQPRPSNLKATISEFMNPGSTDLERAEARLPVLDDTSLSRLTDLLELGAAEIAAEEGVRSNAVMATASHAPFEPRMIGNSPLIRKVFETIGKVSSSDVSILISGDSGSGKELVARAIHFEGVRKLKPFVVQNCSALNDELLESALFGHTRGAFTGATQDQRGLFDVADGGTLFLDEIGDTSAAMQTKLLRVLQEGTFTPVGGNQTKHVDVRVIAATHMNLADMVKAKTFREDLLYRINVIHLHVPSLRERKDDLPLLIAYFIKKHRRSRDVTRGLAPQTLELLTRYDWPGNVRELENEIERLLVLGGHQPFIGEDLVSSRVRGKAGPGGSEVAVRFSLPQPLPTKMNDAIDVLERAILSEGLARTEGNKSRLSRELGISRSNLLNKLKKHHLVSLETDE